MTAREKLNRKMRWLGLIMFASFFTAVGSVLLMQSWVDKDRKLPPEKKPILFIFIPAFFIGVGSVLYAASASGLCCPKCRENLARVVSQYGAFSVSRKLKYCPHCGLDLDSELPVSPN